MAAQTDQQIANPRTRVTRYRLAPGATTGWHRHENDYVIVPLTDGRMEMQESDGEKVADLKTGVSYFRPAGVEHDVKNASASELVFVEIELLA